MAVTPYLQLWSEDIPDEYDGMVFTSLADLYERGQRLPERTRHIIHHHIHSGCPSVQTKKGTYVQGLDYVVEHQMDTYVDGPERYQGPPPMTVKNFLATVDKMED